MSLRYQVFHAIRAGRRCCKDIAEDTGITHLQAINTVSKLRTEGFIHGAAGAYKIVEGAWMNMDDGRGRSPGSSIGREIGAAKKAGRPMNKGPGCLLAECWK